MLKEIGTRKLIVSSLTAIMMLAIGIFENPSEFSFLIVLASFLCAGVSLLRWMVLYDKLNPEEDVFGIGFAKRRFPTFIQHESKMNILALNTYKWIIISIILVFVIRSA